MEGDRKDKALVEHKGTRGLKTSKKLTSARQEPFQSDHRLSCIIQISICCNKQQHMLLFMKAMFLYQLKYWTQLFNIFYKKRFLNFGLYKQLAAK